MHQVYNLALQILLQETVQFNRRGASSLQLCNWGLNQTSTLLYQLILKNTCFGVELCQNVLMTGHLGGCGGDGGDEVG